MYKDGAESAWGNAFVRFSTAVYRSGELASWLGSLARSLSRPDVT